MKIIAKTEEGYVIDASRDEIARLIGYYYTGSQGCPTLKIGDTIKVDAMYQKLYQNVHQEQHLKQIHQAIDSFKQSFDALEPLLTAEAQAARSASSEEA